MLGALFDFIQKARLRHFAIIALVLIVLLTLAGLYEATTNHFRLNQLEHLGRILNTIDSANTNTNAVAARMRIATAVEVSAIRLTSEKGWLIKFVTGTIAWVVIDSPLLLLILSTKDKSPLSHYAAALLYFGIAASIISAFLPAYAWPVSHLLFYPLTFLLATLLITVVGGAVSYHFKIPLKGEAAPPKA